MRGEYESIEELDVEEKKENISKCIASFKEKLADAQAAIKDAKELIKEKDTVTTCLTESKGYIDSVRKNTDNEKLIKLFESFDDEILKLELIKEEADIKERIDNIQKISENIYSTLNEEGYINDPDAPMDVADNPATEPVSMEEEVESLNEEMENTHDGIPGVDSTTAGEEQKPEEYDDALETDPRLPENQHEEVVQGEEITSAYEEGFNRGRQLWEKGINPKNIATQLAETEYSEKPYSYVTRFQEGLVAGCKFQEEVMKDTNPDMFSEPGEDSKEN